MKYGLRTRRLASVIVFGTVGAIMAIICFIVAVSDVYAGDINWFTLALKLLAVDLSLVVLDRSARVRQDFAGREELLATVPPHTYAMAIAGYTYGLAFPLVALAGGFFVLGPQGADAWNYIVPAAVAISAIIGSVPYWLLEKH